MPATSNYVIITPDEAKAHLRLDDADDDWLAMAIPAVQHAVVLWCGSESCLFCEASGLVHEVVKLAALVELARQYSQREGPQQKNQMEWAMRGYSLGPGATSLLQPLRKPTVA